MTDVSPCRRFNPLVRRGREPKNAAALKSWHLVTARARPVGVALVVRIGTSDRLPVSEELVVLIVAAETAADLRDVGYELDA